MPKLINKDVMKKAIEAFATQPGITNNEVATLVGVHPQTVKMWRSSPQFIDAIYDTYMVQFGSELPAVLQSMVNQAKAGNVQAGRLVLEHSGKLVKNVNVTVDSPFEKFIKVEQKTVEFRDAEVQDIVDSIEDIPDVVLPEPDSRDQADRAIDEVRDIKDEIRKSKRALARKKMYKLRKRAEAVGLDPLGKKPTSLEKDNWIKEIEYLESEKELEVKNLHNKLESYIGIDAVYVVRSGISNIYKIGHSSDVTKRIKGLSTGNPEPLHVIAVSPGGKDLEKKIHSQFKDFNQKGEWFKIEKSKLVDLLVIINDNGGDVYED